MTKQTMERDFFDSEAVSSVIADFTEGSRLLAGTRSSFFAEFCMNSHKAQKLTVADQGEYARALFASHMAASEVSSALSIPVGDALPETATDGVGIGRASDFAVLPSPLDGDEFGSSMDPNIVSHFFSLAARPRPFAEFCGDLVKITDRLTSTPFSTTEFTDLTIRVMLEDDMPDADALAFALHCADMNWMNRGGHPNARVSEDSSWSMSIFREVIAQRYLVEGLDLDAQTPRDEWLAVLSEIADTIVDEGLAPTADLAPDRRAADFGHIGGLNYHKDACNNILIAQEMAMSFKRACIFPEQAESYWDEAPNAKLLDGLIEDILRAQKTSSELTFRKVKGAYHVSYHIEHEGRIKGRVISYNSDDDQISDGSLIQIGDYMEYATLACEVNHISALLLERLRG